MCGFHPGPLQDEFASLADYIRQPQHAAKLLCITNSAGDVISMPSVAAPAQARFETLHNRPTLTPANPITLLHILLPCIKTIRTAFYG